MVIFWINYLDVNSSIRFKARTQNKQIYNGCSILFFCQCPHPIAHLDSRRPAMRKLHRNANVFPNNPKMASV